MESLCAFVWGTVEGGEHTHPLYAALQWFRTHPALLILPPPYSAGDSALDSSGSWGKESMLAHGSSSSYGLFYSEEIAAHEEK